VTRKQKRAQRYRAKKRLQQQPQQSGAHDYREFATAFVQRLSEAPAGTRVFMKPVGTG
jgi:hypothetical protein